jgi:hypothetical protein
MAIIAHDKEITSAVPSDPRMTNAIAIKAKKSPVFLGGGRLTRKITTSTLSATAAKQATIDTK